jgi:DNA-binding transcriptional LysR family regulator
MAPRARRLTHLNGIRAFDVVARHMSFARAAEELGVTPAAVSQQVKSLEDYLGIKPFRRTQRAIFLTETAQAMLPQVREGFELVGRQRDAVDRRQVADAAAGAFHRQTPRTSTCASTRRTAWSIDRARTSTLPCVAAVAITRASKWRR